MVDGFLHNVNNQIRKIYSHWKIKQIRRKNPGADRIVIDLPYNLKIALRLDDQMARRILVFGRFEPVESAVIFSLVQAGMTVVDAGANIGIHTVHMAKLVGNSGHVYAFEPNPVASHELVKNLELNGLTNVTVLNIALSNHDGFADFQFPTTGAEAMGSLQKNPRFKVAYGAQVETARLETVMENYHISKVDFIKLDVEGAELLALQGAKAILESVNPPTILYESVLENSISFKYKPSDIKQFLASKHYQVEKLDQECFLAKPVNVLTR